MKISVVYALPDRQVVRELELSEGATVMTALQRSGLLQEFSGIDPAISPVGIYGKTVSYNAVLRAGDRVEIYRPLSTEPKTARRLRSKNR
jgi:putative ubiquitin-RnfH superfamily antitoxin RatB of RatAB toxin-antitoxin module